MKLYAVTKGSYSDYHIITLTADRERADKIAERFTDNYDRADVETYEDGEELLNLSKWTFVFDERLELTRSSGPYLPEHATDFIMHSIDGHYYLDVVSTNYDRAFKAALDRLYQYKATCMSI